MDWSEVKRIAIDEVSHRKGQGRFATVIGDIEAGRLLEVIDSHQQAEIIEVLVQQPIAVREQIEEVSVDMWGGFPKVVETVFPNATLVFEEWLRRAQEVYSEATKTIRNHLTGICNYFRNRTTSGTMEGINNRIKLIKRQAYGFRNFGNFRKRLLACLSD